MNTIPPNDFGFWDTINQVVQNEPAGAGDPEIMGQLAAIGIRKVQPFAPDERMRAILEDAVAVGNATARTIFFAPRESEGFEYYPGSAWVNMLWVGGYTFMDPPPTITADGVEQPASDGARKLNSRICFLYPATGVTPAMCMRLTGMGSQYLIATRGADGEYLDGARTYKLDLPAGIPESRFWSVMLYDNQTRSMLQTDQPMPRLGSQSGTVEQNPDGSTDLYIGPRRRPARRTTGCRPSPARAGSRSCASTAPRRPSSTRPGGRASSSPSAPAATETSPTPDAEPRDAGASAQRAGIGSGRVARVV